MRKVEAYLYKKKYYATEEEVLEAQAEEIFKSWISRKPVYTPEGRATGASYRGLYRLLQEIFG